MSAADNLTQSKLAFVASKRTASKNQVGKAKATSTKAAERAKAEKAATVVDIIDDKEASVVLGSGGKSSKTEDANVVTEESPKPDTKQDVSVAVGRATRSKTKAKASETAPQPEEAPAQVVTPAVFRPSNARPEDVAKRVEANAAKAESTEELPELNIKDVKWRKQHKDAREKIGMEPIHGENQNKIHEILRVFDNSYEYGPCVGVSRLDRWNRAKAMGLKPPEEVGEILRTKQGSTLTEYSQSVYYEEV